MHVDYTCTTKNGERVCHRLNCVEMLFSFCVCRLMNFMLNRSNHVSIIFKSYNTQLMVAHRFNVGKSHFSKLNVADVIWNNKSRASFFALSILNPSFVLSHIRFSHFAMFGIFHLDAINRNNIFKIRFLWNENL